jgi:hypothetical protein
MKKIYCFDIDGTICSLTESSYDQAEPFRGRISTINRLYDEGHTIKYFTARGSTTGIDWTQVTKKQLSDWGAKYHELHLGKPHYDLYVGDKACGDKDFFGKSIFEEL